MWTNEVVQGREPQRGEASLWNGGFDPMSSARKRAAIQKANNEADHLRQRLMRAEHHASVMQSFAEAAARKADALAAILTAPVERGKCANLECVWWGGGAYLAGFNDATAADIMAGTLRERLASVMGSNAELRPLDAALCGKSRLE